MDAKKPILFANNCLPEHTAGSCTLLNTRLSISYLRRPITTCSQVVSDWSCYKLSVFIITFRGVASGWTGIGKTVENLKRNKNTSRLHVPNTLFIVVILKGKDLRSLPSIVLKDKNYL